MSVDPELAKSMKSDLLYLRMSLMADALDLEHAEKLLLCEFEQGGVSGRRAEAIALIHRVRQRLDKVLRADG